MYQRLEGVNEIVPGVMRLDDLLRKEKKNFLSLEFRFDNFSVCSASTPKSLLLVLKILGDFDIIRKDETFLWFIKQVCSQFMQQINHLNENKFFSTHSLVKGKFYDKIVERNCTFERHQELSFFHGI